MPLDAAIFYFGTKLKNSGLMLGKLRDEIVISKTTTGMEQWELGNLPSQP